VEWVGVESKIKPQVGRLVLCYCPEWNEEGYQVAVWKGKEFTYGGQPNEMFDGLVLSWNIFLEAD